MAKFYALVSIGPSYDNNLERVVFAKTEHGLPEALGDLFKSEREAVDARHAVMAAILAAETSEADDVPPKPCDEYHVLAERHRRRIWVKDELAGLDSALARFPHREAFARARLAAALESLKQSDAAQDLSDGLWLSFASEYR